MSSNRRVGARAALLAALAIAASGCMTKTVRTPVFDENAIEVLLRHEEKGGKPVDRGFSQPITIAPVRLTNILARIEVRKDDEKERQPAIPTDLLYPIGEGISRALAKADSSQVVVVLAKQRKRNLGIFTQDFLTSVLAWVREDQVFVKLGMLDVPLSKDPKDGVPEPLEDQIKGKNRAVPADGISVENAQLVSANWRDPIFKDSSVISIRAGGQVVRRTVLMDSGEAAAIPANPEEGAAIPPQGLSPDALRALADLEDERRRGEITEAEYQSRRREILAGGMPASAPAPASAPGAAPK